MAPENDDDPVVTPASLIGPPVMLRNTYKNAIIEAYPEAYWRLNHTKPIEPLSDAMGRHHLYVSGAPTYNLPGAVADAQARSMGDFFPVTAFLDATIVSTNAMHAPSVTTGPVGVTGPFLGATFAVFPPNEPLPQGVSLPGIFSASLARQPAVRPDLLLTGLGQLPSTTVVRGPVNMTVQAVTIVIDYLIVGIGGWGYGSNTGVPGGGGGGGHVFAGAATLSLNSAYPVVIATTPGAGTSFIGATANSGNAGEFFNGGTAANGQPGGAGAGDHAGGGGGHSGAGDGVYGTGTGGPGYYSDINGTGRYYGAGGGGGSRGASEGEAIHGGPGGSGGAGGQGGGSFDVGGTWGGANATTPGSGGGGGGGGMTSGGRGGDGIVIVRYAGTVQRATGGTISTIPGYVVHTFVGNGTFSTGATLLSAPAMVEAPVAAPASLPSLAVMPRAVEVEALVKADEPVVTPLHGTVFPTSMLHAGYHQAWQDPKVFSLSGWFYHTNLGTAGIETLVVRADDVNWADGFGIFYVRSGATGTLHAFLNRWDGEYDGALVLCPSIPDYQWTHVQLQARPQQHGFGVEMQFWVNAVLIGEDVTTGPIRYGSNPNRFIFGNDLDADPDKPFLGRLGDWAFFTRWMNQWEIADIVHSGPMTANQRA